MGRGGEYGEYLESGSQQLKAAFKLLLLRELEDDFALPAPIEFLARNPFDGHRIRGETLEVGVKRGALRFKLLDVRIKPGGIVVKADEPNEAELASHEGIGHDRQDNPAPAATREGME